MCGGRCRLEIGHNKECHEAQTFVPSGLSPSLTANQTLLARPAERTSEQRHCGHVLSRSGPGIRVELCERRRLPVGVAILVDQLRTDALDEVGMLGHEP